MFGIVGLKGLIILITITACYQIKLEKKNTVLILMLFLANRIIIFMFVLFPVYFACKMLHFDSINYYSMFVLVVWDEKHRS